jgi:hypothetical protein
MRVHNTRSSDGKRTIYAQSAANAIWGAIRRKVNIISISWTVKGTSKKTIDSGGKEIPNHDADAIEKLEKAIEAARKEKILIFCSSSDQIEENAQDTLPYGKAQGYVFRIGAALAHGQSAPQTGDRSTIDYFFPGIQVAGDVNPQLSQTPEYYDGSSVGTALAAGLASLIMYLAVIMKTWNDTSGGVYADIAKKADELQKRGNMKQAFDNIGIGKPEDKYLEVWKEFGAATEKLDELEKQGIANNEEKCKKMMELLAALVRRLCNKVE